MEVRCSRGRTVPKCIDLAGLAVIGAEEHADAFGTGIDDIGPVASRAVHTAVGQSLGEELVCILLVLNDGQAQLLEIALAGGAAGVLANFLEDGEQNSGEYCNDSNNDEQLDQGEALRLLQFTIFHSFSPFFESDN